MQRVRIGDLDQLLIAELGRGLEYWRGVLGAVIMLVMVLSPSGVLGGLQGWWLGRRRRLAEGAR